MAEIRVASNQRLAARCFEAAEGMIRGTGLRRSRLGRTVVSGLNTVGQFAVKVYVLLKRQPAVVQGQRMDCRTWEKGSFRSTLELLLDRYEPETTRLFHRLLGPGMAVVDVGAHGGYFSLMAASRVGATGKVYAFEPHPVTFEMLERNIKLNGYKNIAAIRKAVANETHGMKLLLNPKGSDRHSLYRNEDTDLQQESAEIEATTLDDFLGEQGWPHVDLVKMDIEGAEPAAFAGMRQTLEKCGVRYIVMEFSPSPLRAAGCDPGTFLQEVTNMGFRLYVVEEEKEPKALNPKGFSAFIQALQDKGGTNLLCEIERVGKPSADQPCDSQGT